MRKFLDSIIGAVLAPLFLLTFSSCEKVVISEENETGDLGGNLRISVFQIEKTPFASLTRATVEDVCSRLNFAIYDQSGARLKQANQTSDMADFGHVSFQLEPGTYQVVVVAHSSNGNPTMTNPNKIQFSNTLGFTDTFLFYGEVTVDEDQVALEVSLDRIVSLCRFVVTDDFPANVKKMRFYYTGGSGAFDAATGLGCVNSKQDVKFDVVADQNQFDLYTFLHDMEGTIHLTVTALDASGNELYNRSFDVPMEQNHITWLSGAFFDGSASSATTITTVTINTNWAGESFIEF